MKRFLPLAIIAIIISIAVLRYGFNLVDQEHNKYKKELGKTFIFKGDTLIIINYSNMSKTFELDNGLDVNADLIWNSRKLDIKSK